MALIKCSINNTPVEIDESHLEPFRTEIDNDVEHTIVTGWKLFGAIVQNDVSMVLKKPAVFTEAVAAPIG